MSWQRACRRRVASRRDVDVGLPVEMGFVGSCRVFVLDVRSVATEVSSAWHYRKTVDMLLTEPATGIQQEYVNRRALKRALSNSRDPDQTLKPQSPKVVKLVPATLHPKP